MPSVLPIPATFVITDTQPHVEIIPTGAYFWAVACLRPGSVEAIFEQPVPSLDAAVAAAVKWAKANDVAVVYLRAEGVGQPN